MYYTNTEAQFYRIYEVFRGIWGKDGADCVASIATVIDGNVMDRVAFLNPTVITGLTESSDCRLDSTSLARLLEL